MRVEVDVQPDREHAERDDAAVEVAAHPFFVSLSRGLLLRERCGRRCGQGRVLCGIFGPINARKVKLSCCRVTALRRTLQRSVVLHVCARVARSAAELSRRFLLVCYCR